MIDLPGTHFKSQPLRHSLVHFTRSMHMEAPLGKRGRGTGGYWSEPEGGRTRLRTRVWWPSVATGRWPSIVALA